MEGRPIEKDEVVQQPDGYRIVELNISNIKRIKAINITPKSDLVILEGDNAMGKTSVMDSISYLIGGKRLIPEEPIRKGEKRGYAEAMFGDFQISRTWTNPYTSYLKIKTKDGVEPKNPQTFLNERIGSFSLEVAELVNMDKDERVRVFKRITGLNLDDLSEKRERTMELRKDKNKDLARLEAEIKNYEDLPDIKEGLDIDVLQKDRIVKEDANNIRKAKATEIDDLNSDKDVLEEDLAEAEQEIISFQKKTEDLKKGNEARVKLIAESVEKIAIKKKAFESMGVFDLSMIDGKIKEAVEQQGLKVKLERKKAVKVDISLTSEKIDKYNKDLETIKGDKTKRIKESAVPVEGVEFDGESIRYKGIEFEECSTAEQIEISIAIGIKENPKIRIILIRDGSAIGKAAKERIQELAKETNFQIWIERVAETKGNEIFIEDGEIK